MEQVERHLAMPESDQIPVPRSGDLIALVDSLDGTALDEAQRQILQILRQGIHSLAAEEWSANIGHVEMLS